MSKIIKLHRGTANTMNTSKKDLVLESGEIFAEVPDTGVGTGKGRLVMGDGVTTYSNLPSFIENGDIMQVSTLPSAEASFVGKVYQYIGATENSLTHGYFYECISDGESSPTYSWVQTNVQPNSGGGGGGSYTAGDGIDIDTNNVISTEQSVSGDMDEIVDSLPQGGTLVRVADAFNRGDIYSETERMIGQWIDGKPIYQKTISGTTPTDTNDHYYSIDASIDKAIDIKSFFYNAYGTVYCGSCNAINSFEKGLKFYVQNNDNPDANLKNKLVINVSQSSWMGLLFYATICYTKTTDSAISIGEETEYSTTEKIVGTWIDGKPLYQKTVDCGALPNNDSIDVNHNISNASKIYDIKAVAVAISGSSTYTIPNSTTNNEPIDVNVNTTRIRISCRGDWSAFKGFVTIQYTKTT